MSRERPPRRTTSEHFVEYAISPTSWERLTDGQREELTGLKLRFAHDEDGYHILIRREHEKAWMKEQLS